MMRDLGGPRVIVGILFAAALVGLQIGFLIGDQFAKVWPWAETLTGRLLIAGIGWLLLALWASSGHRKQ